MTQQRAGYHNFLVQLPDVIWQRLCAEAGEDVSVAQLVTRILARHFKVPLASLPKPKRAGRKPRRP